ncbi:hypothetical protein [Alkanindiges illinoisensis]|uniref:hypothetical protein n=1 Tax=Alkanindiges illinoisensis TaxID=197183 RepID=UPI00047BBF61|nr:hypothetical protein [Alkanindiges illinoisensis]
MKRSVLNLLLGSLIVAVAGGGFYYYQQGFKPKAHLTLANSSSLADASVVTDHVLKPDPYVLLKDSIKTLAQSKQFSDFIKTDQLLQQHLNQLSLAQRYEVMESFLRAVNQHISLVDGEKRELSLNDELFLETISEEDQANSDTGSDIKPKQRYPYEKFATKLISTLPPLQANWLTQALNYDFEILNIGEGFYTIRLNPNYLVKHFAPALSRTDQIFIKALAQQNQEQFYYDAGIAITWKELGERAVFWEQYAQKYPKSFFAKDAKVLADYYLYFFIYGMDNTHPLQYFDEQENKPVIESEAEQAFMLIKDKYPNSNVSQKIRQFENSVMSDQKIIEPVEPTERSILMGQL